MAPNFLEAQWPDDIPQECPHCHAELHPKINLSFGYGKLGRTFKTIAWWISLPWAIIMIFTGLMMGGILSFFILIAPYFFFTVLTAMSPSTRRVRCFPCKYSKDYPAMPNE